MRILVLLAAMLLSLPALAGEREGDTVVSKHVHTVAVNTNGDLHVDTRSRDYQGSVGGCDVKDLEALLPPVIIKSKERTLHEGSKLVFNGADGTTIVCDVEMLSKL